MIMRPAVLHPYRPTYTSGEVTLLARLLGMTQAPLPAGENLANTRYRARARGMAAEIPFSYTWSPKIARPTC